MLIFSMDDYRISRSILLAARAAVMGFPDIEASEIGNTGLLWLFVSYGYALFWASNQISEGSDLLLLVPSLAGIVGSCVLPVLGAVPDGAIMLFSGLGSVEEAQENLAIGVGALAGSTIMLLTARGRRLAATRPRTSR